MRLTEEQEREIRGFCYLWISRHDSLKLLKSEGLRGRVVDEQKERLLQVSRDLRDAITKAGI
jgi:RecB family endonuclease NucS